MKGKTTPDTHNFFCCVYTCFPMKQPRRLVVILFREKESFLADSSDSRGQFLSFPELVQSKMIY